MSITFFCPQAPTELYVPYPEDEPEHIESRPVAPFVRLNLSNSNAYDMLAKLDPAVSPDSYGEWNQEKLRAIQRRLMLLLNTDRKDALVKDSFVSGGSDGCGITMYESGRSDEYVTRRLREFQQLVAAALQHEFDVTFC